MRRIVEPELLDHLAPDDPRAIRSRRDLVRVNAWMRQPALMARALAALPPFGVLADLGGGDGRFMLSAARRLRRRPMRLYLLDRQNILSDQTRRDFAVLGWDCQVLEGDIFRSLAEIPPGDSFPPPPSLTTAASGLPATGASPASVLRTRGGVVIAANLFLHHFSDAALAHLLSLTAERAGAFVALEPRRSAFALLAAKQVWAIGANDVTRHDAAASVRAGFAGRELSALWPPGWRLREGRGFLFTHCFTAVRNG